MTLGVSSVEWSSTMIHSQSSAFSSVRDRPRTAGRLRFVEGRRNHAQHALPHLAPRSVPGLRADILAPSRGHNLGDDLSRGALGRLGYFRMFGRGIWAIAVLGTLAGRGTVLVAGPSSR
jgi:hypothetical protein